jgi:magnesium chelatase accessory protein
MPEYRRDPGTGSLHYLEFGQGEPLLLLHGNGADAQLYMPILAALSPHYHILAPDLPGHGFSRGIRPDTISAYVDLIETFIATHITGPFRLIGHSLGGLIAYLLMQRGLPIHSAVWMEPAIFELRPLVRASLPLYANLYQRTPHVRADVVRHLESLAWDAKSADPVRVAAFVEAYMRSDRQVQALWLRAYPQLHPWDFSALQLPIHCIRGQKDTFISRATTDLVPRLPQGSEYVLPHTGHCLLNENNPGLVAAMQGFFQGLPLATAVPASAPA